MESFILDVLSLVVRWLHLITGIAWIGASFYFIWLDNSLETPPQWKKDKGIKGDLWSFHGGGIYEVAKYASSPEKMPKTLHWFYWEAYSTWITGICLMFVVYYFQASTYLVNPTGWVTTPSLAVFASLAFLASGVGVYELLLRAGVASRPLLFAGVMVLVFSVFSYISSELFASRAAYLHMGAMVGTIMAANVFIGIVPPQRAFVRAIDDGLELPLKGLENAKLRSTHNNYFTLPVLFCMISNHYPLFYGHRYSWLVLIAIFVITASSRQFFNLKHKGIHKPQILVVCAMLFIALCGLLAWDKSVQDSVLSETTVGSETALAIADVHCSVCHAENPTFPGILAPPLGVAIASEQDFKLFKDKVMVAVSTNYMPLGNVTGMSEEERTQLLSWLNQL